MEQVFEPGLVTQSLDNRRQRVLLSGIARRKTLVLVQALAIRAVRGQQHFRQATPGFHVVHRCARQIRDLQ